MIDEITVRKMLTKQRIHLEKEFTKKVDDFVKELKETLEDCDYKHLELFNDCYKIIDKKKKKYFGGK